jgi:hypothetical protein
MDAPKPAIVRRRTVPTTVLLTPDEREELKLAAKQSNLNVSTFLRMLLLTAIRRGDTLSVRTAAE